MANDGPWKQRATPDDELAVDLTRLENGRVMCQLCWVYTLPEDLYYDEHERAWDVCGPCQWRREGLPRGQCVCNCCVQLGYWNIAHRRRPDGNPYTMAEACKCATFLDRDLACKCTACYIHAPSHRKNHWSRLPDSAATGELMKKLLQEQEDNPEVTLAYLSQKYGKPTSAVWKMLQRSKKPQARGYQ